MSLVVKSLVDYIGGKDVELRDIAGLGAYLAVHNFLYISNLAESSVATPPSSQDRHCRTTVRRATLRTRMSSSGTTTP